MITKATMVVTFNLQNSHLLPLSLPTEEVFQVNGQIGRWQIFQLSIFILSREKCQHYLSHWMRKFRFFFYFIGFLRLVGKFEPLCLSAIRIFKCFRCHNLVKLRQTTCIENREGFAVHSSTWPSGAKGEWCFSSWLAISTHVKKHKFFHVCWDGFSQGRKSLYNIVVYVINHILLPLSIIFYHNIDVK